MAKLYDSSDNLLSKSVQVVPAKPGIKVENVLLDGQTDIQIIGDYRQEFEVAFYCPYAEMEAIQEISATGDTVKLTQEGTDYTCNILGAPDFRLSNRGIAANRYYEGKMTLGKVVE